jgi:hypothetical protein
VTLHKNHLYEVTFTGEYLGSAIASGREMFHLVGQESRVYIGQGSFTAKLAPIDEDDYGVGTVVFNKTDKPIYARTLEGWFYLGEGLDYQLTASARTWDAVSEYLMDNPEVKVNRP